MALRHLDRLEPPGRRDEEAHRRAADPSGARPATSLAASGCPSAAASARLVEVDAGHELDELRVVPTAEPRGDLDHLGPAAADPELRGRGPLVDPERLDRAPRHLDRRLRVRRRPDVAERDPERRRRPRQMRSVTASGTNSPPAEKPVTVDLGPVDVLLDEHDRRVREASRAARERAPEPGGAAHDDRPPRLDRSAALTTTGSGISRSPFAADELPARLRDARGRERLALPELARREERRRRPRRVREAELLGDPCGDRDRRVGARRRSRRRAAAPRRAARSRARRRSRRCSAGRRARTRAPPGRGRRPPSRSRVRVPPRAARAAPGPAPSTSRRGVLSRAVRPPSPPIVAAAGDDGAGEGSGGR